MNDDPPRIDVTHFFYPIIIAITGWYIVPTIYRLPTEWGFSPIMIAYAIFWGLVPIGFIYLWLKGIRLKLRFSFLSVVSFIILVLFLGEAIALFLQPGVNIEQIFMTGQWDHTFFPIAFGLFFLCDLREIPKRFWVMLIPFAIFNFVPNVNVVGNVFFDTWVIGDSFMSGPPGFFNFWAANTWSELHANGGLSCSKCLMEYVHEQITFFTLFPFVIFYYLANRQK